MRLYVLCMLVLYISLGALAALLGFSAHHASNSREYHVILVNDICIYPDSPAQTSGLLAGLILLLAQMLVIVTCGCSCRWTNQKQVEGMNATLVGLGCIFGCFVAGLGAAYFAAGSALSRPSERYRVRHRTNTSADCVQPKFTTAIAMLFCAQFLGTLFFIGILREARKAATTTPLPQVAQPITSPEIPPPPPPTSDLNQLSPV